MNVVVIDSAHTHALRRSVLRNDAASEVVEFDGDDDPTTFHLGIRNDEGHTVAISTWIARPHPDRADEVGFQIRGMATDPSARGRGLGRQLLDTGLDVCRARGADHVWARARVSALGFYTQAGFALSGSEYIDEATGLPHHDIMLFDDE